MKIRAFNLIPGVVYRDTQFDVSVCILDVNRDPEREVVLVTSYANGTRSDELLDYCQVVEVVGLYVEDPVEFDDQDSDIGRDFIPKYQPRHYFREPGSSLSLDIVRSTQTARAKIARRLQGVGARYCADVTR